MTSHHSRTDGVIIAAATGFALVLMLHHPTSLTPGQNDDHLLGDWSNGFVHAAMIGCILALAVGLDGVRRRLGETRLAVRTGTVLIGAGLLAVAGAAVTTGLAAPRLIDLADPVLREAGLRTLWALNQSLTGLGTVLVALGAAAWSPGLWHLSPSGRVAAVVGLTLAVLSVWHATTDGGFGLHVAVAGMAAFALWFLAVAAAMILLHPEDRS